ncbi:unnamed protein product [Onchocerca ochengi]|uniref:Tyrosine-protein phosphatase domain-containing protein n=1 Tax=Onchocerca ochengi TaxID=42157 RepID=A0A182ED89_ONCOC|nr:unnamed protein product [Onchocerca ochengi]
MSVAVFNFVWDTCLTDQSTNGLICTKRVKSKRTSKANKPVLGHTNAAMCIVELLQMKVEQVQYAAIVAFQMRIA